MDEIKNEKSKCKNHTSKCKKQQINEKRKNYYNTIWKNWKEINNYKTI